jgi:hypothetical protein
MKMRIIDENVEAEKLIPPTAPDGSGIGVNYVDAYIKPMNVETEDGPTVSCKRKGLKLILSIDDKTGEAIMRRIEHGPDVKNILRQALMAAAKEAEAKFTVEEGCVFLEV